MEATKIHILVPERLNYDGLCSLLTKHYTDSINENRTHCLFDWRETRWVCLPELVTLLSWSSKLLYLGKQVEWFLPNPRESYEGLADIRFAAQAELGNERYERACREIDKLKHEGVRSRLYPNQRQSMGDAILNRITAGRPDLFESAKTWIDQELASLVYLDVLGYMGRYQIFRRAEELGIKMTPDPRTLPKALMSYSRETGSLELRPIHSLSQTEDEVSKLCDPDELARVLGEYADLDIVRRGALAQILVNELGRNVGEHSAGSVAWLCTRLVKPDQVLFQTEGDPALQTFRADRQGFLEIIICDNGDGLVSKLRPVLEQDTRKSIQEKYSRGKDGSLTEASLVDYAFDRLSSSKRNIAKLIHIDHEQGPDAGPLASGLYWVWNLVKSHHGVLIVQTGRLSAWYDFFKEDSISASGVGSVKLQHDSREIPFCGTLIRVCFPLSVPNRSARLQLLRHKPAVSGKTRDVDNEGIINTVWIGDIARKAYPLTRKVNANVVQLELQSAEMSLLHLLQAEHSRLGDGEILVLDLCGARTHWSKQSVAPLCHFFLEMNFTATSGRSAVVLWNVPALCYDIFEKGIALANGRYSQISELRRAALLIRDDGEARIFCGWPLAEQALAQLAIQGELSLEEMSVTKFSPPDQRRFNKLVTENSHLFHWSAPGRVQLRHWPQALKEKAWADGLKWLENSLDTEHKKDGVKQQLASGYYRLSSSGKLVQTFYSFSSFLSHHENRARISWLLAQLVIGIGRVAGKTADYIVSITRSSSDLVRDVVDNYPTRTTANRPHVVSATTVEALEALCSKENIEGTAIFLTDVVSTGRLCFQISRILPKIKWLGTVAILDTREAQTIERFHLEPGITCNKITPKVATGDVFALSTRIIVKRDPANNPSEFEDKPIYAIDKVNVSPIEFPVISTDTKRIWHYLDRRSDALKVGHFSVRGLHHNIYHVNAEELLETVCPQKNQTLLELLVNFAVEDLNQTSYEPNHTIIIHPPSETSYAFRIAKKIQEETGILYRDVLHRDLFAGQRRFSTFVQHGLPVRGRTVVLIDDGTNTGETLIGLLDAAVYEKPQRVLTYCALARMPLHKLHFFGGLKMLGQSIPAKLRFATRLSIPVFSPRSCPICRFQEGLNEVIHRTSLLRRYAEILCEKVSAIDIATLSHAEQRPFLWRFTSQIIVAKLREGIELAEAYDDETYKLLVTTLNEAVDERSSSASDDALLNLGFIIACEPDLISGPIFAPYVHRLVNGVCRKLKKCPDENVFTFFTFGFHLVFQIARKEDPEIIDKAIKFLWQSILSRADLTVPLIGQLLASILAEHWPEQESENILSHRICVAFAQSLRLTLGKGIAKEKLLAKAFAWFFARGVLSDLQGEVPPTFVHQSDTIPLFDHANAAAGKFYGHAAENVKSQIDTITECGRKPVTNLKAVVAPAIHELLRDFDELEELRQRLCLSETQRESSSGGVSGVGRIWNSPQLFHTMSDFAVALAALAELVDRSSIRNDDVSVCAQRLSEAWRNLHNLLETAFQEIFPNLVTTASYLWSECCSIANEGSLNVQAIEPANLSRTVQVFLPRPLLSRFLTVAIQNFRTAAFFGWSAAQMRDACVWLNVKFVTDEKKHSIVVLQVIDNGPSYPRSESGQGQHRGLNEIKELVGQFGCELILPKAISGRTFVELRIRHRSY